MRIEKHPYNYNIKINFPGSRDFWGLEFTSLIKAELDGKAYLIIDDGTMADFLDEDDPLLDELVIVFEFDTEEERDEYAAYYPRGMRPPSDDSILLLARCSTEARIWMISGALPKLGA